MDARGRFDLKPCAVRPHRAAALHHGRHGLTDGPTHPGGDPPRGLDPPWLARALRVRGLARYSKPGRPAT